MGLIKKQLLKQAKMDTINEFTEMLVRVAKIRYAMRSEYDNLLTINDVNEVAKYLKEKIESN